MRRAEGTEVSGETQVPEQDLEWRSGSGFALSCLGEEKLAPPPSLSLVFLHTSTGISDCRVTPTSVDPGV